VRSAGPEASQASEVLRRFRIVFNAVKTHFRAVERSVGIGGAQLWALSVVRDRPGITVGELARALDVHPSTASNLVRSLSAHQMIAATKQPTDRRSVRLTVLENGERVLRRAPQPFAGVLPAALETLDAETLARLDRDLSTLIAVLGADRSAARIPISEPDAVADPDARAPSSAAG